ncbi:hypothetical protein RM96_11910 [Cupriavidus sp. IDO]|nr:hypothetical protein RM96_11910 [Cupriavidus sp. IDO]
MLLICTEDKVLRRITGLGSWMLCCFAGVAGDLLFEGAKKEAKSAFLPAGRESYRSELRSLYGYGLQGIAGLPAAQIARGNAGNGAVLPTS